MKKNPGRAARRQAQREAARRDNKQRALNRTVLAKQIKKVVSE